jgi:hypothetical protein
MDLTDTYRVFHPTTADHTFFLAILKVSRIYHILGQKANINKYQKVKIVPMYPSRP